MLKLMPSTESTSTAAASEAGTIKIASSVIRQLRRKNSSTNAASTTPINIASRTELAAASTSVLWSYHLLKCTPGGICGPNPASACCTSCAMATELLPRCWNSSTVTACLPSADTSKYCGATPALTSATSARRNTPSAPPRTTMFFTSSTVCNALAFISRYSRSWSSIRPTDCSTFAAPTALVTSPTVR